MKFKSHDEIKRIAKKAVSNFLNKKSMNISKEDARKKLDELDKTSKELRAIIEAPESKKCVMERIKTFSDACQELGINPCSITNNNLDTEDEVAYKKLKVIIKALQAFLSAIPSSTYTVPLVAPSLIIRVRN